MCGKNFIVVLFLQNSVVTLHPPHYDAVTCLTLYQSKLFSACNKTLKQWSMKSHSPTIMQVNLLPELVVCLCIDSLDSQLVLLISVVNCTCVLLPISLLRLMIVLTKQ